MKETINKLREIAGKSANQVTRADREFIREQAALYGIELPKDKPNCKSCYVDAAVQIWRKVKDSEPKDRKWVLKAGVDVIWNGIRINAASCTSDEKAEQWIAKGFPTIYFK